MAKVRRANVILSIKDSQIEHYVAKGFNVLDDNGNVIREAIPNDAANLRALVLDKEAKLTEKDTEIADLKAEIKKLKKQVKEAKASDSVDIIKAEE